MFLLVGQLDEAKGWLRAQTYKQAKERPDLIVITVDPGWVKTGTFPRFTCLPMQLNITCVHGL